MRPIFKSVAFARRLAISMGTQSILTVLLREAKPGCKQAIKLAAAAMFLLGLIAPAVWAKNTVQPVAGGGPNNLPALKSSLGSPTGLALDGVGNVYVADLYSARVLRVGTNGNVTVVAGNAARGGIFNAQGVPAITARLTYPTGVPVE